MNDKEVKEITEIELAQKKHKRRHQTLHAALDELFADFVMNSGRDESFTKAPIIELINWSYQQTIDPTHEESGNDK